jgi:hypothetical protein
MMRGCGAIAVLLVCSAPAAAPAALDIAYERAAAPVNPGTQGPATALCPAGMEVSGGGANSDGGYGEVGLNTTYPPTERSWRSFYDSDVEQVEVESYAICVNRNAQFATKEAVSAPSAARARCPSDRRLTGGGGYSSGTYGQTVIQQTAFHRFEDRRPKFWHVFMQALVPVANIEFTSWAVCHRDLDVSYRRELPVMPADKRFTAAVRCRPEERVVGGGGAVGASAVVAETFPIDDRSDGDAVRDNGWRVTADNFGPRDIAEVQAICVDP